MFSSANVNHHGPMLMYAKSAVEEMMTVLS